MAVATPPDYTWPMVALRFDSPRASANNAAFEVKRRTIPTVVGLAILLLWTTAPPGQAGLNGHGVRGSVEIHDPSTIIKCKDRYYLYGTGRGILSKSSADGIVWMDGPAVFATPPAWVKDAAPGFNGDFWAPDIVHLNGRYCLYYSVSSWGSQQSAIGLATNPTLDPADPAYQWTDEGIVIQSEIGSPYNTIDPAVAFDAAGNPWLVFGSYWTGIYLIQLDPVTGRRSPTHPTATQLAYRNAIEAACLFRRGAYYYLFVNWGSCCSGVNSTYNIRVGRSLNITGPYRDRNGVDMRSGGGTLFTEASGKFTGPGHPAVFEENGQLWISYHYYDAGAYAPWYGAYGAACFDIQPLQFTDDDWPVLPQDWSAHYQFEADARDENGQYYGLLQGGATIQTEGSRGRVLNLNGAGQYVWLPAGVANARTFSAVVKWNGGADWQRIFDFGTDTTGYVMLTPASADRRLRCDIRVGGTTQTLEWSQPLPVGVWTHVALVFADPHAVLYVNGTPVATNLAVTLQPYQVRAQTNHLGRSKFVADADFNGQISSFRVYSRALSATEIAAPVPTIRQPTVGATFWPGTALDFAGAAVDFNDLPLAATQMTWRVEQIFGGTTNLVWGPASGIREGRWMIPANAPTNAIFRVSLAATNAAGRGTVVSRSLVLGSAPGPWSAYYPFTSNANDASNRFHGTLMNGAAIINDADRGSVVRLRPLLSQPYVNLPAGVSAANTISGWVKWSGGNAWQRFFDFGVNTGRWLFFSPKDSSGRFHCAITLDSAHYVRVIQGPTAFPVNEWVHVAVMFDGQQGVLYTNGQPAAINHSVNLLPGDLAATKAYLGRSQFTVDPYFNGRLDAIHLHSRSLSPAEIFGPTVALLTPGAGTRYAGGDALAFSGYGLDYTEKTLAPAGLSWEVELVHDHNASPVWGPLPGATNGVFTVPTTAPPTINALYRVRLTGTDARGLQNSVVTEVPPRLTQLALSSVPEGLTLQFESQPLTTPTNFATIVGMHRLVEVPSPQSLAGSNYHFVQWSDGGAAAHTITIPATNLALTAFCLSPALQGGPADDGLTLSWPDWAAHWQLMTATNLAPPVSWWNVTNVPHPQGNQQRVQLPLTQPQQYFRLQSP